MQVNHKTWGGTPEIKEQMVKSALKGHFQNLKGHENCKALPRGDEGRAKGTRKGGGTLGYWSRSRGVKAADEGKVSLMYTRRSEWA